MPNKYHMVRQGLEQARSWLAETDEADRQIGLICEQLIELVAEIEHRRQPSNNNVVPFPANRLG